MARRALVALFIGTCFLTQAAATAEDGRQSAALRRSCESGKMADCVTLARFLTDDGASSRTMQKACQAGDAVGCGMLYWAGDLVPKDLARSASEFKKACDAGRAVGCAALAEMQETGQGVPKDPARSEAWGQGDEERQRGCCCCSRARLPKARPRWSGTGPCS